MGEMDERIEKRLGIYREIPHEATFSLLVSEEGEGQVGSPLGRVREQYGEEFDVTDRVTGAVQHISLAHLRDRDPQRTLVAWRWSYRPKRPLTEAEADRLLAHQRELHPDLEPKPGVRDYLTGKE